MKTLAEKGRLGERLDGVFVVDAHAHIGPWFCFPIPQPDAQGMLKVMDRIGTRVACISGLPAIAGAFEQGNDMAFQASREHPTRFKAYVVANPNHPQGRLAEVERGLQAGAFGIKIHTTHGKPYDHELYQEIFRYANDRELPILVHTWGRSDMEKLSKAAKENPRALFLAGHSGVLDIDAYCTAAQDRDNLFLETCTSLSTKGLLERMCHEVSAEKILFGSDMVFISEAQQIGRVLFADLSDDEKMLILGENAKRLFRL